MVQHNDSAQRSACGPSTMSPLRKAMSLSTLFRQNTDGRHAQSQPCPPLPVNDHTAREVSPYMVSASSPSTLRPMKRLRRRLSLRSPSTSPSAASIGSTATPSMGTPSSIASTSTCATATSSIRGRPRSGSCRASLLGGGRILPFTLPSLNGEATEQKDGATVETPKGRYGTMSSRSSSVSPPMPPRRPITPAPLLILDEEMNSLGITTGPLATWQASGSGSPARPSLQNASGLGLSASMSSITGSSFTHVSVPGTLHRMSLYPSQESFQCRGLDRREDQDAADGFPIVPPPMTRSVSASTAASGGGSGTTGNVVPGSPLGWRRRPWALSLQLQSSNHVAPGPVSPGLTPSTARTTPADNSLTAAAMIATTDESRQSDHSLAHSSLDPRSRFSSSSEGNGTLTGLADDDAEEDEELYSAGASNVTSPSSTWSSSAFSFDTTLESPASRHSSRFATPAVTATNDTTVRRRSNTVLGISSSIGKARAPSPAPLRRQSDDSLGQLPPICPASPPTQVRLQLTLPPTSVAKHAGLPAEHTMLVPTTSSTLELKELISQKLLSLHGFSISPSQLGLFVVDLLNSPAPSASPSTSPRPSLFASGLFAFDSISGTPPSSEASNSNGGGFLRARLRNSMNLHPSPQQLFPPPHYRAFRQLENETVLYQEGLQDDDTIIVRF